VIFALYMLPVMLIDNILKPILMGRGVEAPMLVIFVGALGGFAARGFIGLFTGAIVLVLAYELFLLWLRGGDPDAVAAPEDTSSVAAR
jgi:predicted PurR-regulated permease PerM